MNKEIKKRILSISCAVALFLGGFGVGYFAYSRRIDDELRELMWVKQTIQSNYNYDVSDEMFYEAVFGGVNSMLDKYSYYLDADEYQASLVSNRGEWSGIGISYLTQNATGEDQMLIVKVSGNSPAEKVGIKEGMAFVAYGDTAENLTYSIKANDYISYFDGKEKNEEFYVKAEWNGGENAVFALHKEAFVENYVFYRNNATGYRFTGEKASVLTESHDAISSLPSDTGYIRLTQFNGNAVNQFAMAMDQFKADGKKNLILDLRRNGGGDMQILCNIARYFLKNATATKPVVVEAVYGSSGKSKNFYATANFYDKYFSSDSNIYVMADNGTASASECLIGCMHDYGALPFENIFLSPRSTYKAVDGVYQTVTETKTYGKGIMQTFYTRKFVLPTSAVKLTSANIYWPVSKTTIHGVGVTTETGARTVTESYETDGEINSLISVIGN